MYGGMGGMGNMAGMMKKVQKLQSQMKTMQEDLKKRTVEVTAGGGAVKVVINGDKELQSLTIDKAAVDPEDVEMLQDLVMAAVNESIKKVDDMMAAEMGKLTSGLGLPPGMI
ncbi:MAG: YbaB/EbfC family nucleoid-associated protein [Negativicutes bacterium]